MNNLQGVKEKTLRLLALIKPVVGAETI